MKTLTLHLITQKEILIKEPAVSVTLKTESGEITILPEHNNMFTIVKPSVITIKTPKGQQDKVVSIGAGFAHITADSIKILADNGIRAENIDIAKVEQAKQAAEKAMKNKQDTQKFLEAQNALRQSLLQIEASRKWKKIRRN